MPNNSYYVVFIGRIPGIYNSQDDAHKQIQGFRNCEWKKYSSFSAAEKAYFQFQDKTKENLTGQRVSDNNFSEIPYNKNRRRALESSTAFGRWGHFLGCVGLHMILPLSPPLFEYKILGFYRLETIALTGFVYNIAISIHSKDIGQMFYNVVIGIVFFMVYYFCLLKQVVEGSKTAQFISWLCIVLLFGVFFMHLYERYIRHIVYRERFFHFKRYEL